MKLAIVGCRNWSNYDQFVQIVQEYIQVNGKPDLIISGGATGVDTLARCYAYENKIELLEYLPDWLKYKRAAGPIRNTLIVEAATHVLALPSKDSVGTYDTIRKAQAKNLHVTVVHVD